MGSIPDNATSSVPPSQPLSNLLDGIGEAVANLNTIVVGLDAVEKGHEKPDTLNISWNPHDRKSAARKSRKFVLESAIVRNVECLSQFVLALSKLPRFEVVRNRWNGDTSAADKIRDIFEAAVGTDDYLVPGTLLLAHWRNRIVHTNSKAKLNITQINLLRAAKAEISEKFSGLDIDRTLSDFDEQRPTLKDISSLISMAIRSARKIDLKVSATLTKDDLDSLISFYEIDTALAKVKAQTSPEKLDASIRRVFLSRAPKLLDAYIRHSSLLDRQ